MNSFHILVSRTSEHPGSGNITYILHSHIRVSHVSVQSREREGGGEGMHFLIPHNNQYIELVVPQFNDGFMEIKFTL